MALFVVECADGSHCHRLGTPGSDWEDCAGPYFLDEEDARAAIVDLDDPTAWESWPIADRTVEQCRAKCGPHRMVRYVRASVDLAQDRAATWRVLGIDPEEAEKNNCWLAPSVASALDALRKEVDRLLCISLLACLGEMKAVIQKDAGKRYSGASIDFAYDAAWKEFAKRAPAEEVKLQDELDSRHIAAWLR